MDVRAEEDTEKVQNGEAVYWTLKQSEARRKSKIGKLKACIGR